MRLTEILHDAFLTCGEILPAAHIAQIIWEYEFNSNTEHDAETILCAIRDAGEQFVDSMQGNTSDGYNYEGRHRETETAYQEELDRWEAMRPSVVRRKAIEVIATPAPTTTGNTLTKVSDVARGEYVRFSDRDSAPVWIKGHYDRSSKTYSFTKAEDMNHEMFRKGTATCFIGFSY